MTLGYERAVEWLEDAQRSDLRAQDVIQIIRLYMDRREGIRWRKSIVPNPVGRRRTRPRWPTSSRRSRLGAGADEPEDRSSRAAKIPKVTRLNAAEAQVLLLLEVTQPAGPWRVRCRDVA